MLLGGFFFGWWESNEQWFWPFEPSSKLKATFCKYGISLKIKIIMNLCVQRVYMKLKKSTGAITTAKNEVFIGSLTWKMF